jgi:hypothetical protein
MVVYEDGWARKSIDVRPNSPNPLFRVGIEDDQTITALQEAHLVLIACKMLDQGRPWQPL